MMMMMMMIMMMMIMTMTTTMMMIGWRIEKMVLWASPCAMPNLHLA